MGIGLVIAVLGVGSTLASTITINGGTNKEFGQGVQRTVYCGGNKQITVTPVSSYLNVAEPMPNESESSRSESESESATPSASALAGTFYLSGIKVSEIPKECSGVDFVFSVYNQRGDSTPIIISSLPGEGDISTPTVFWYDNPALAAEAEEGTEAESGVKYGGLLSASRDSYSPARGQMELLVFPENEGKGSFTIKFKDHAGTHALINDVGRVVIETQNDTIFDPSRKLVTPPPSS
jgi:hypothetical protein